MILNVIVTLIIIPFTLFICYYSVLYLILFNIMLLHQQKQFYAYGTASTNAVVLTFVELVMFCVLIMLCRRRYTYAVDTHNEPHNVDLLKSIKIE